MGNRAEGETWRECHRPQGHEVADWDLNQVCPIPESSVPLPKFTLKHCGEVHVCNIRNEVMSGLYP